MLTSSRVKEISESITLKLNAKAVALAASGKKIFNLTAGQLPVPPDKDFANSIKLELDSLKSFQYGPVAGLPDLRKKFIDSYLKTRNITFPDGEEFDCVVSNGGKHVVSNVLYALINPGDEVITLAPYWVSYPEIIKLCQGVPIVVKSSAFEAYVPAIEDIRRAISPKTKAIILNSPNNPAGIYYSDEWMESFAELMLEYDHVQILSDEIYYELNYFDPKPTYFYQKNNELLKRTIIIDGISKSFASTGLRVGYCIAPKKLTMAIGKLQGQTTSGANTLIQRALIDYDFDKLNNFLDPVKNHLRENSEILKKKLRDAGLGHCWYQSTSAFYFLIDFSGMPFIENYKKNNPEIEDYSFQICDDLLEKKGVATVPGTAFGVPNSARFSLVLPLDEFTLAIEQMIELFSVS